MIVKARIKDIPNTNRSMAHCGRCRKALWEIQHHGDGSASLMQANYGWAYDAGRGAWYPTEAHLAKRHAAHGRVRAGREQPGDRGRLSRAHGLWGRSNGFRQPAQAVDGVSRSTAVRLPTRIVCDRCRDGDDPVMNEVAIE